MSDFLPFLPMNFEHLEHFVKVAELNNISAAAEKLHISQPALSRQMKLLEESLGIELFDRGGKSIHLTRAGQITFEEASDLLLYLSDMKRRIKSRAEKQEIRISYAPSLTSKFLKLAITKFTAAYPDIRVSISDLSTSEIWRSLRNHEIDVAIEAQSKHVDIEWRPLIQFPMALAVPEDHPLAHQDMIHPEQIKDERLLSLNPHHYPDYWTLVSDYLSSMQLPQQIFGEFDGMDSMLTGVMSGLGICFISQDAQPSHSVKLLPLTSEIKPVIQVAVGTARSRILEPHTHDFIRFVNEACAEVC